MLQDKISRSPHGERGLKSVPRWNRCSLQWSLPAWGAWIEIKRGMEMNSRRLSLPAWGAWIEIHDCLHFVAKKRSLPAWGAWIEITTAKVMQTLCLSLPAWGAWIEIETTCNVVSVFRVAPRMGSVD